MNKFYERSHCLSQVVKKNSNPNPIANVQATKLPNPNTGTSWGLCWRWPPAGFAHVFLGLVVNVVFMSAHQKKKKIPLKRYDPGFSTGLLKRKKNEVMRPFGYIFRVVNSRLKLRAPGST